MVFVTHRVASWSIDRLRRLPQSVATTRVLIFICCCYYGSHSTAPKLVSRCRFALIPPVIVETSAQSASEWGQLTPAEEEGVDGRRSTATGNNTAAGCLMPINIRQKWEILAGRLALANFPKGCEVIFLASPGIQGLMYLLELNSSWQWGSFVGIFCFKLTIFMSKFSTGLEWLFFIVVFYQEPWFISCYIKSEGHWTENYNFF